MSIPITTAPYETAISSGFTFLGELTGFLEKLSPAFIELIQNNIALHKGIREQRIMDRRVRKCKRLCRIDHLTAPMIYKQVGFDFPDLTQIQRTDLTDLLVFELITNVTNKTK